MFCIGFSAVMPSKCVAQNNISGIPLSHGMSGRDSVSSVRQLPPHTHPASVTAWSLQGRFFATVIRSCITSTWLPPLLFAVEMTPVDGQIFPSSHRRICMTPSTHALQQISGLYFAVLAVELRRSRRKGRSTCRTGSSSSK